MVRPGSTILFRHVEAVETVKVRPAVVLKLVGDSMLLIVGQTQMPQGAHVLVSDKQARLAYSTYFDCRQLLAVPIDRVERVLGRVTPKTFEQIELACGPELEARATQASEDAQRQRQRLDAAIRRHAEATGCSFESSLDSIADEARIARMHLREVVSGSAWWTRDEISRIAEVLGVDAMVLLAGEPEDPG
jgi:hypothetical protein